MTDEERRAMEERRELFRRDLERRMAAFARRPGKVRPLAQSTPTPEELERIHRVMRETLAKPSSNE